MAYEPLTMPGILNCPNQLGFMTQDNGAYIPLKGTSSIYNPCLFYFFGINSFFMCGFPVTIGQPSQAMSLDYGTSVNSSVTGIIMEYIINKSVCVGV